MMRIGSIVPMSFFILLVGCSESTQPEARRAESTEPQAQAASSQSAPELPQTNTVEKAESPAGAASGDADGQLRLDKLAFSIPEGWQRKELSSSFVLAEFVLPAAEKSTAADGRLTVSAAGGSIEANVQRWRDQFGGKPDQSSEERKEVHGLEVVFVDLAGEFNDQRGPLAPGTKRPGYRMLAAIIPVDGELHFVKAVGPQATIAAHAERFQEFVGSATKKE